MPTEISGSTGVNKIQDNTIVNADINSSAAIDASKLVTSSFNVYPTSSSHLVAASDAQNIDIALSAGTYIFVSVTRSGSAQSEVGFIVSDGSSLTTVSHASQTGSISWANSSGTTLRIRDENNDKELLVFGWRIR